MQQDYPLTSTELRVIRWVGLGLTAFSAMVLLVMGLLVAGT